MLDKQTSIRTCVNACADGICEGGISRDTRDLDVAEKTDDARTRPQEINSRIDSIAGDVIRSNGHWMCLPGTVLQL